MSETMRQEMHQDAKQEEILEKLDRDSRKRTFRNTYMAKAMVAAAIIIAGYHLYTAACGTPATLKHRSLHVAMMLAMTFLVVPAGKHASRDHAEWYDWILAGLSCMAPIYMWTQYQGVIDRAGRPDRMDVIMATILVVLVLEAARRFTGWILPSLCLLFILYGIAGRYCPGMFMHRGYNWTYLSNHFFANTEGIYGTSVSVAASYIFLFILFGSVMNRCGMGQFFNDLAMALAGHSKGGPAKVSVIASGLLGSINGSAVANVVTTGAFTIPLMKKTGYSAEFAGAVEASASVGGQLLPPIMGAAAFIMAQMLGIEYSKIVVCAAIPALLYYLGILVQVQLRASKEGLNGLDRDVLPKVGVVMKAQGHLMIPILFLLVMLFASGRTVIYSAVCTILVTILVSACRKSTRMGVRDILGALADGTMSTLSVAVACACVGIVVGVCSKTGFGLNMANAIISLGGKNLFFTLIFTMVTCMVLGMGLPSIPAYIITATIAAPALTSLGIPAIAAHMFSFYFAMFANITPPVALASFAAAGLSGGDPMKTGFASVKLSIAGFIVPYMFIYTPQLLLLDTGILQGIWVTLGACLGVVMIGVAIEGYFVRTLSLPLRALAAVGAICLIDGSMLTDAMGVVILLVLLVSQFAGKELTAVSKSATLVLKEK